MAQLLSTKILGAWIFESKVFPDERGAFREWFKTSLLADVGIDFTPVQANLSTSKKGVVRGIHFSTVAEGQSKWVTCARGRILDVVVDIRPDSPTFKMWDAIELDGESGKSLFISAGLGHAFLSLEDESVVSYLLSSPYAPEFEFEINPLDPEIAIEWPISNLSLSPKDAAAPSLSEFLAR